MKIWLRSCIFNVIFYIWTFGCSFFCWPVLFFSRSYIITVANFWSFGVFWICERIGGIHFKLIGKERIPTTPVIFASKHQSAWETIVSPYVLSHPAIVLKEELMRIPFFGGYLKGLGMIPLSRSKNKSIQDLKNLLRAATEAVAQGRSILIFPEGTRSAPGHQGTYHSGIASLYQHLNIPVVPIAHNAGLFWPRRGFIKRPGCITLEFLTPIQPGLSRHEFMRQLTTAIETKTNELVAQEKIDVKDQ